MAPRADLCIVTLGVEDVGRSSAFYAALGWDRTASSSDEITWFRTPHSYLGLFGYEALAEDARLPADPRPAFGGVTLAVNCASEGEVDAFLTTALEAGARVLKPPEPTPWGGYSGYFADPDGHPWEVATNPGFPIGEDGRLEIA
jgi:hypothetical protein